MLSYAARTSHPSFSAALPSTTVHVALLIGAIWGTRASAIEIAEHTIEIPIDWAVQATHPATSVAATVTIPGAPVISEAIIPRFDLPGVTPIDPRWREHFPPNPTLAGWTGFPELARGDTASSARIFSESDVDDPPSLLTSGLLRYPAVLAEAGIDGAVTLTFVIDTAGKVDPAAIEILSATHPGFVEAAKEAVRTSLFRPARKRGAAVRVRVRQTITFKH